MEEKLCHGKIYYIQHKKKTEIRADISCYSIDTDTDSVLAVFIWNICLSAR